MKKKKFLWMLAAILTSSLMTVTFTACSSDDDDNNSNPTDPYADIEERVKHIEVLDSGSINMYDCYKEALQAAQSGNADETTIEYLQQQIAQMDHTIDSIQNAEGGNVIGALVGTAIAKALFTFTYTVINVPTTSYDGSTINMTTLLAYPKRLGMVTNPNHVLLLDHFTITNDSQRPTDWNRWSLSKLTTDIGLAIDKWSTHNAAGIDCLVIAPDYEGYGSTKDRVHPYLNREVQAHQCVDAVCWGQAWFNTNTGHHLKDNWSVVSVGYSQGGAVSAASYRYWLDHPEIHWVVPRWSGAVCGDGPYDPYATLKYYCEIDYLEMPCAPLLMLNGLCKTDPEMIAAGIKPSDFCTPLVANSGIFEAMAEKNQTTFDLDMKIFGKPVPKYPIGHKWAEKPHAKGVFNDDAYFYFLNGTVPSDATMAKKLQILEHCLKKNALWYKDENTLWTPPAGSKFTFFHALEDKVVPYVNMQSLLEKWGVSSRTCQFERNNTNTSSHTSVGTAFFVWYYSDWVSSMYENTWTAGYHETEGGKW